MGDVDKKRLISRLEDAARAQKSLEVPSPSKGPIHDNAVALLRETHREDSALAEELAEHYRKLIPPALRKFKLTTAPNYSGAVPYGWGVPGQPIC